MRGYKGLTIYKSGSYDFCEARACGEGLKLGQGQVGARLGLYWSWAKVGPG